MRTTSDKRGDGEGASKNERLDHGGAGRWRSEEERYGIGGEAERRLVKSVKGAGKPSAVALCCCCCSALDTREVLYPFATLHWKPATLYGVHKDCYEKGRRGYYDSKGNSGGRVPGGIAGKGYNHFGG